MHVAARCSGATRQHDAIVVQFGTAMMPGRGQPSSASGFTSGTASGTSGSIRNALELSMQTVPPAAIVREERARGRRSDRHERDVDAAARLGARPRATSCSSPRNADAQAGAPRGRERHEPIDGEVRAPRGCASSRARPRRSPRSPRRSCQARYQGRSALGGVHDRDEHARREEPRRPRHVAVTSISPPVHSDVWTSARDEWLPERGRDADGEVGAFVVRAATIA